MPNKTDDSICPLCQKLNRCDVNSSAGCWCMNTRVPQALLNRIPTQLQGVSCVCNKCIERYHQQQVIGSNAKEVI